MFTSSAVHIITMADALHQCFNSQIICCSYLSTIRHDTDTGTGNCGNVVSLTDALHECFNRQIVFYTYLGLNGAPAPTTREPRLAFFFKDFAV